MSDGSQRSLERAASDDAQAEAKLRRERCRAGEHEYWRPSLGLPPSGGTACLNCDAHRPHRIVDAARAVLEGKRPVVQVGPTWHQVFAGNVTFVSSDGWLFTVFNDCDDFDYFDEIVAPDGERWDFPRRANEETWVERALQEICDLSDDRREGWGVE